MKIMKHLALVGLMIAVLFSLWACTTPVDTTGGANPNNPNDPGDNAFPGSSFVQGDQVGIKQVDGDSWRLTYYELENGEETTLREFFDAYLVNGTSETFESVAGDYTWTVDGVAAEASTPVKKGSNIVATTKDGEVKTPAAGQMKLNVTIYHPTTGQQMGAGIVVDGSSITMKELFETHISGGSQSFEDCLESYVWYVDGKEATAETLVTATSEIKAKMLTPAGGGNTPNDPNPNNPENPGGDENPGGFEQGEKIGVRHEDGDSFRVMYFEMQENELTLREFFDTYVGGTGGGVTFEEEGHLYTWTVDGEPADANTPVKIGSNVVANKIGSTTQQPEEGQIKLPVTIVNPENGMQQGASIIANAETIKLGEFFETYVSGGSQSFEDASAEYEWYVDGKLADENTVLTKDSEITAVLKDNDNGNQGGNQGDDKIEYEELRFVYRYVDLNGIARDKRIYVMVEKGDAYTLGEFAAEHGETDTFADSLHYGNWKIDGKEVGNSDIILKGGETVIYTQTVEIPVLSYRIIFEVTMAGALISSNEVQIPTESILLKELFDGYLNGAPDNTTFAGTFEDGYWLVNGEDANADTLVLEGSKVVYVLENGTIDPDPDPDPDPEPEGDTLLTPEVGEVLVSVNFGNSIAENIYVLDATSYTVLEFYNIYLAGDSGATLEDMLTMFAVTVDGEAATADTVITSQSVIAFEPTMSFPVEDPEEGMMSITFREIDEEWAMTSVEMIDANVTLRWFYEFYQSEGSFESSLLSYEWRVDGELADADTVLTEGCVITKTFRVAEGAFSVTIGETFGEETYLDRVVLEGSEITVLNLYLHINGDDPEFSFEETLAVGYWTVNGEVADADTVIRSDDVVIYVCFLTDIMVEINEGDGNSTENIEIVIPEGMTVGEFVNEYLSLNGAFDDYEWYLNGEAVAADDLFYSADGWIYLSASRIGAETPEPGEGEIRVTLEIFDGETARTQILIIPNTGMTLGEFFNTYLAEEWGITFEESLSNYYWMVDWDSADASTVLMAEAYIYAEYAEGTHPNPGELSVSGDIFKGDAREYFAFSFGVDTINLYDLFYYYLEPQYELIKGTSIDNWEWYVNGELVTDYLFEISGSAYIEIYYANEDGGDDNGCAHNWDASTGTCYECGEPCPEDHSLYLGEDCPTCGFNTNGGENTFYFLTFIVDGEYTEHTIILPPNGLLQLDAALLDFLNMDLAQVNGSYDVYVDGELATDAWMFINSMATIELRPIGGEGGDVDHPDPIQIFDVYGIQYLAGGYSEEGTIDPFWWMKDSVVRHTFDHEMTLREILESWFYFNYDLNEFTVWVNGEIVTDVDSCMISETSYVVLLANAIEFGGITLTLVDETTGETRSWTYDYPVFFDEIRDELIGSDFDWDNKLYTIVANGYEDMMYSHFEVIAVDVTVTVKFQEHQVNIGVVDSNNSLNAHEFTVTGKLPTFEEYVAQYLSGSVSDYRFFDLSGGEARECEAAEQIGAFYSVVIPASQIKNPITVTYHVTTMDGQILEGTIQVEMPSVFGQVFNSQDDVYFEFLENVDSYLITTNGVPMDDKTGIWYMIVWGDCDVVVTPTYTFNLEFWGEGEFEVQDPIKVTDPNMTLRDVLAMFDIDLSKYALSGDYDLDTAIGERFSYGWNAIGLSPKYVNFRIEMTTSDGYTSMTEIFNHFVGSVTYEELLNYAREYGVFDPEGLVLYVKNDNGEMVELTDPTYTWSVPEGESSAEYLLQFVTNEIQINWELQDRNGFWIGGDMLMVERGTTVAQIMELLELEGMNLSRIYENWTGTDLAVSDVLLENAHIIFTQNSGMLWVNIRDDYGNTYFDGEIEISGDITVGDLLSQHTQYTWDVVRYAYCDGTELTEDSPITGSSLEITLNVFTVSINIYDANGMWVYGAEQQMLGSITLGEFLAQYGGGYAWEDIDYGYCSSVEVPNAETLITYDDKIELFLKAVPFTVTYEEQSYGPFEVPISFYDFLTQYVGIDYYMQSQYGYWMMTESDEQLYDGYFLSRDCVIVYVQYEGMGFNVNYNGKEIYVDQLSVTLYDLVNLYLGMDYYTSIQNGYWTVDGMQVDEYWTISGYCEISYVSYGDVGGGDGCAHMFGPSGSCDLCGTPCPEDHNVYYGVEPCPICGFVGDGGMMATEYFFSFYVDGVYQTQLSRSMWPGEYVTLDDLLWEALGMTIDEAMKTYELWVNGENVIRYAYEIYGDAEIRLDMIMPSIYWITYNGSLYSVTPDMSLAMAISHFGYIYEELAPYGYFTVDGMMVDDPYNYYFTGDCTVEYVQTSMPECEHMWIDMGYCELCEEPCPEDHSGLLLGESCWNCTWMINGGKYYIINVTVEDAGRAERLEYVTDTLTLDTIAAELGINARDYIWYLAGREIEYAEGNTLHDYSTYYYGDVELLLRERYVAFGYYVLNEFNESVVEWTGYETSGLKFHGSITFGELLGYAKDMGIEDVNAYNWKFYSYSGEEFYLDPAQDADYVFDSHDAGWEATERAVLYDFELSPKNSFGVRLYVYDAYNNLVDELPIIMTEAKQLYTFLSDCGYSYWNCSLVEVRYPNQYEPIYSDEYTYVNQRYDITIYLAAEEVTEEGAEAA